MIDTIEMVATNPPPTDENTQTVTYPNNPITECAPEPESGPVCGG
ncbi:hypothetical protein [Thermomonospora echinospora]|nr:hypothetical protein [Thermomonospora echinospora]